jgi:hypothetical protein
MFEDYHLDTALNVIEPLWQDGDRFKQRAAAEIIQGILRGIVNMKSCDSRSIMLVSLETLAYQIIG